MSKWDERFMRIAMEAATWSKDPDHKVGAAIKDKNNRAISFGFNGPPKGVKDTSLEHNVKVLRSIHAEINAILHSRVSLEGCTIYVYPFSPCAQCAAAIIQVGITRVVFHECKVLKTWKASQEEAFLMFREAEVDVFKVT